MKIAVVVSGWHFPLHFFKALAEQQIPTGWTIDLFCVSHRDPQHAATEKKEYLSMLGWSYPEVLDKVLYEKVASRADIEALGWKYLEYPNTIGDLGNTNQWLEDHDYKQYDILLASHDDNLILNDRIYIDLLVPNEDWLILTNARGSMSTWRDYVKTYLLHRAVNIRGSFEFFKRELLDILGGKFDLSEVTLKREGEVTTQKSFKALNNWNMTTVPFQRFLDEHGLAPRIKSLSDTYRVSDYCIEGERGFISSIQPENSRSVEKGLWRIQKLYAAKLRPLQ